MKYNTEKTVTIEVRGEAFIVELRMISLRERSKLIEDNGEIDVANYFEENVVSITGPEVNGKDITTLADAFDTPGMDELYQGIVQHINDWDLGDDEVKN